jgi:hypothetical protein
MARNVFFSFHHQMDIWRVSQIRNSWVTQERNTNQFLDAASWEAVKKKGVLNIQSWINRQLRGTSVTVVLIGSQTATRKYVNYEIEQSHKRGNGLLGIYIHNVKNSKGIKGTKGENPFESFFIEKKDPFGFGITYKKKFSDIYPVYDWFWDSGRENLNSWIEKAAKAAGR